MPKIIKVSKNLTVMTKTIAECVATHGCCRRSLIEGSPDLMAAELSVNSNTAPTTTHTKHSS